MLAILQTRRFALVLFTVALVAAGAGAQEPRVVSPESIREVARTPHAAVARVQLTPAEEAETMEFEVVLKMRKLPELQARVARRELVSVREMAAKYHPVPGDYAAVVAWLKSEGLKITREDSSHIAVFGSGTVAQVSQAFQAAFSRVTFRGRERSSAVTAPQLPVGIAEVVLGVNGLQPHLAPQKHSRQLKPQPLSTTGNGPPFLPSQIAKAYNATGVTSTGAGQTIGIVIDTFPSDSDLTSFWATCGVAQNLANIQKVQVVAGALGAPSGEETLDVEWSSSMAPGAKVRVYATLDLSFTHLDQAYAQIYSDVSGATPSQPSLHQISLSYGLGELYMSQSQMQTDEQYFANLASAGVTVFVSSGDGGSNPTSTGASGGTTPTPESPSNSYSVTCVGGTSLYVDATTGLETSETVWSGTGGGVSTYFARPGWQTGSGVPAGTTRVVPDVAAPADPNTGAYVFLNGAAYQYGGTSWSSPVWAGFCAIINQARATNGIAAVGLLGPKIYPLLGTASFRDITSGSNGAYSAAPGFDLCTGMGVPNVATLVQALSGVPIITTQAVSQSVAVGQNAVFSVVAGGQAPFTYQWQREAVGTSTWSNLTNSATYTGTTTASLTVTGATAPMSGDQFRCVVTNALGNITSSSPSLLVGVQAAPLVVATLAGQAGATGTANGTGSAARFNSPGGIAIDAGGNVFAADTNNHTIRKITAAGVVSTVAGTAGTAGSSNTGSGTFNYPSNVAVDSSGNVYVADSSNHTIRKITSAGVVTTLAGRAGRTGSTNATGSNARFNLPLGVAVDGSGNVFVADANNNLIRKVTAAGAVTTLAGGAGVSGSSDGTGTAARFNYPVDVAVDGSGNVYVADTNNQTIRKITPAGVVTTIAGTAGVSGSSDGIGSGASFNSPSGVRLDSAGNIYIADANNNAIRLLTPAGLVTTIAGLPGTVGSADGVGSGALFNAASNAAPDASGNVYIIDTNNQTLRKATAGSAPAIQAQAVARTVLQGQSTSFNVAASGNPVPGLQWQRLPAGGSTWADLTNTGAYSGATTGTLAITGAATGMSGDQFRCVATNVLGSAVSNAFALNVGIAPQITSAKTATFNLGQAGSFPVTATGTPAPTFSATGLPAWASLNASSGALTGVPPNAAGSPFSIAITATNGFGSPAVQQFSLTVQSTFAAWQSLHFGANFAGSAASGPLADPDGDGIPNLLEYATGTDPLLASSNNPPVTALTISPNDGLQHLTLTATLDASATDITPAAQVSSDLQTWQSGAGYTETVSDTTANGVRTLVFRDAIPLTSTSSRRFIRLQISR